MGSSVTPCCWGTICVGGVEAGDKITRQTKLDLIQPHFIFFYTVSDHAQEAPMFLSGCFFGAPTTDGNNCEGGPNVNEMTIL